MVDGGGGGGGGWDTGRPFGVRKNTRFGDFLKTTQYFSIIISAPHRSVLKTFFGTFRIGKIGKFSTQKSRNIFFLFRKMVGKNIFFGNFSKTT